MVQQLSAGPEVRLKFFGGNGVVCTDVGWDRSGPAADARRQNQRALYQPRASVSTR